LGDAIAVSFQQISRYETGSDRISAANLIRICDALRTSVGDLCAGIGGGAADPPDQPVAGAIEQLLEDFVAIRDPVVRTQLAKLVASLAVASSRDRTIS